MRATQVIPKAITGIHHESIRSYYTMVVGLTKPGGVGMYYSYYSSLYSCVYQTQQAPAFRKRQRVRGLWMCSPFLGDGISHASRWSRDAILHQHKASQDAGQVRRRTVAVCFSCYAAKRWNNGTIYVMKSQVHMQIGLQRICLPEVSSKLMYHKHRATLDHD